MTRDPIFDPVERSDRTPAKHSESGFQFLNRVCGQFWEQSRAVLQTWADHILQDTDYLQLRSAIRANDDGKFRSAYLELYLHEMFLLAGYDVEIHPRVLGSSRRPDFLMSREGNSFYVEAIAPGTAPEAQASARREGVVLDLLNEMNSPNFLLSLSDFEVGPRPLNTRALRHHLQRWLSDLDPDAPVDPMHGPEFEWQSDGWQITIGAIPKSREFRGAEGRTIGIYAARGGVVDDASRLRSAIEAKQGAYGALDRPFLIAVGTYFFGSPSRESATAFYGTDSLRVGPDGSSIRLRMGDGYFGTPPNWNHTGVSAVLAVNQLMPYSVLRAESVLWRHPSARHALAEQLGLPVVEMSAIGEEVVELAPRVDAASHFGLPGGWPSGEPWA